MKEISIFIDESGDFGKLNPRSPYYIVTMVFHDQATDISTCLESLEQELTYLGYPQHCLHAGPIIRMENEFNNEDIIIRRSKEGYSFRLQTLPSCGFHMHYETY